MEPGFPTKGAVRLYRSTAPSTGNGSAFSLGGCFRTFSLQGGPSAGVASGSTKATVQLQGSLDGSHWVSLGGTYAATTTWGVTTSTSSKPVSYVRLNIVSFTTRAGQSGPDVPVDLTVNLAGVP